LGHIWGTKELYAQFWWGNLKERDYLEDQGIDGRILITIFVKELGWEVMAWNSQCQDRDKRGAGVEIALGIY